MIKGLSYQNGVFFIGKHHISCAYDDNGTIIDWVKPNNTKSLIQVIGQVVKAMPFWFKIFTILYFSLIFIPKFNFLSLNYFEWRGLPYYFVFYFLFGTHFIFPKSLRKYHGAEHKVFSYRGIKTMANIGKISEAQITNRYCSTNLVVVYFSFVILGAMLLATVFQLGQAVAISSYGAVIIALIANAQLNRPFMKLFKNYVLHLSYFLQKKITTTSPDEFHLKVAIRSYRRLALREFPNQLRAKPKHPKEEKKMAIVDITIIPIGTNEPSVSEYVAEIHQVLEGYQDKVDYQLTPMSTLIEGELPVLFEVIQALHEVPFSKGAMRVATNIRIDDRRDKLLKMTEKLRSVEDKLKKQSSTSDQESE